MPCAWSARQNVLGPVDFDIDQFPLEVRGFDIYAVAVEENTGHDWSVSSDRDFCPGASYQYGHHDYMNELQFGIYKEEDT